MHYGLFWRDAGLFCGECRLWDHVTGAQLAQWDTSHLADKRAVTAEEAAPHSEATAAVAQLSAASHADEDHVQPDAEEEADEDDDADAQAPTASSNALAVLEMDVDPTG